jgi:dihydrofolate reductase
MGGRTLRKVVAGLFTTIDGVVEAPDQWQFTWDDEMAASLAKILESCDTVLLGRVTYEMWAGYWPNYAGGEDAAFADWINNSPKYVVSTTLENVEEWQNSHLIKGDLASAIKQLKEGEGKDITVAGSPGLVATLVDQGLLDELQLMINPVVAGEGRKKLFAGDTSLKKLELASAQPTSSGVILVTYRPKR